MSYGEYIISNYFEKKKKKNFFFRTDIIESEYHVALIDYKDKL